MPGKRYATPSTVCQVCKCELFKRVKTLEYRVYVNYTRINQRRVKEQKRLLDQSLYRDGIITSIQQHQFTKPWQHELNSFYLQHKQVRS